MGDFIGSFVNEIYILISSVFESITGVVAPNASEPIIFLAYVLAYVFIFVLIIRLVISVVRWFYRI